MNIIFSHEPLELSADNHEEAEKINRELQDHAFSLQNFIIKNLRKSVVKRKSK